MDLMSMGSNDYGRRRTPDVTGKRWDLQVTSTGTSGDLFTGHDWCTFSIRSGLKSTRYVKWGWLVRWSVTRLVRFHE